LWPHHPLAVRRASTLLADGTATVTTADIAGERFVLVSQRRAGSSAADVEELDNIVASIRFEGE